MPIIFSLDKDQRIQNEIFIAKEFILLDDEFICIEIGNGFDWHRHAQGCADCHQFLSTIGSSTLRWMLRNNEGIFLLDLNEFGNPSNYFINQFIVYNSSEFHGTRAKFKKILASIRNLEMLRKDFEYKEEYERCGELRDAKRFLE